MELNLDLESFLQLEKKRIQAEKQRLSARSNAGCVQQQTNTGHCIHEVGAGVGECAALKVLQNTNYINEIKCNISNKSATNKCLLMQQKYADEMAANVNDPAAAPPPTTGMSSAFHTTNWGSKSSLVTKTDAAARVRRPPPPTTEGDDSTARELNKMFDPFPSSARDLLVVEKPSSVTRASTKNDEDKSIPDISSGNAAADCEGWSKTRKDLANRKELKSTNLNVGGGKGGGEKAVEKFTADAANSRKREKKDDMEQWVSDTFYSYFPGFNNEYQKRQYYLRERQLEYQQNLLKHQQMTRPAKVKDSNAQAHHLAATSTARSSINTSSTDKTDLEIIVNNPSYAPNHPTPRPGSTRHKLLQDLHHTELSRIVSGDGILERNRHAAEIELARKQAYQRELMQQIEEKRRSLERLREEERRQEEALNKRLQEQLKTMKLEEELEKERFKVEKLRFNTEQNRVMREQLLAKLENDSKLLKEQKAKPKPTRRNQGVEDASPKSSIDNSNDRNNNNKVYKYFSNSASHEYRRGHPLPANVELDLELPESLSTPQHSGTELECFHLSEKICPMCDAPLKSYESCCLRCQCKLSSNIKSKEGVTCELKLSDKNPIQSRNDDVNGAADNDADGDNDDDDDGVARSESEQPSYSLVCSKCERLYALCSKCLSKSDVCRACHRQRNVCMSCRRTLCSFCLEEVACGRDAERHHINEQQDDVKMKNSPRQNDSGQSARSFEVLEVKYTDPKQNHDEVEAFASPPLPANDINYNNNNYNNTSTNNKLSDKNRPPYSLNIERNSIFHPNYEATSPESEATTTVEQLPKLVDKNLSFDLDSSLQTDENANLERVRKETERRLMRYVKNYGDLRTKYGNNNNNNNGERRQYRSHSESLDRSTQTTPISAARRDVVLHEEHNLSMPLLREMPRMTRREAQSLAEGKLQAQAKLQMAHKSKNHNMMENLMRRWEIPAVQKHSISNSPPVLTQVGAMRRQLQAERLMSDD